MARRRDEFADYYDDERDRAPTVPDPPRFLPHLILLTALLGGALAAVHYFAGPMMFRKVLLALATPIGVAWVLLLIGSYWSMIWRIRILAFCSFGSWFLLTLFGNSFIASFMISTLERPYLAENPFKREGKLDVLLVLGGGSDTTPAGVPQLSSLGDRLATAARLYHAGKVSRILVSGLRWSKADGEMELFEESAKILADLKVPESDILQVKVGVDTSEEIQALKRWLDEPTSGGLPPAANPIVEKPPDSDSSPAANDSKDASSPTTQSADSNKPAANETQVAPPTTPSAKTNLSVGILTSAWHLPRAMKLAKKYGIEATPIPSNFLTEPTHRDPNLLIPSTPTSTSHSSQSKST